MKKLCLIAIIFFVWSGLKAQDVKVIKWEQMESLISKKEGKIKVINFWATWCAPCIKELPYFEVLAKSKMTDIEVNLISLDFADQLTKVQRFTDKKALQSNVLLLDEIDYNSWIDKVDKSWSGAIPATLIINETSGKRKFVEGEMSEGQLEKIINEIKTKP